MFNLRGIDTLLQAAAIAACTLAAVPGAHAANAPDTKQASGSGGDLRQQEAELRKILTADPKDTSAHLKLGQVYIDEANYAAAEEEARAAKRGDSKYSDEADALLAWSLFLEDQRDRLLAEIKPGDREPHAEAVVRMSLGLALVTPLTFDKAQPLLRDAVRLDPSLWRARDALARSLIIERKLPEAREQLAAARAAGGPDQVGITLIEAFLDRAAGDTDGAIAKFTQVLKSHTTSVPSLVGRADALISQDKLTEARQDIGAAFEFSRHPQILFMDSLILARQGKIPDAGQLLMKASPSFSHFGIGNYLYGVINVRLGLPETAESYLSRFQVQQPNVSGVNRVRAQIAMQGKRPAAAIEMLKPLLEVTPADQEAAATLARAYVMNGQPDQVIAMYQEMLAAPPRQGPPPADFKDLMSIYGDSYWDLAEIEKVIMWKAPEIVPAISALRQNDVAKASEMAEALATKKPDDPWTQNVLGEVRVAQKQFSEAEAIFRRVLEKHPEFAASAFNLVGVLVAEKQIDDAKAMLHDLAHRKLDDST